MNADSMQKTILVVDDDPDLLKLLALRLTAAGYLAQIAESGERALAVIAVSRPDVVVTDLQDGRHGRPGAVRGDPARPRRRCR